MKDRLREIIKCKTNGRQKDFADVFGWKPSYVGKLLAGTAIGIQPIMAILRRYPDINARWLLLGEGRMIEKDKESLLRDRAVMHIAKVIRLERYLPCMTDDEISAYERMVTADEDPLFDSGAELRWMSILAERQMENDVRVNNAMRKSDELCRQQTADK